MKPHTRSLILLTTVTLMLTACGSATGSGTPGEIVGISAQVSLEEAQSGNIKNLAYRGTVVVRLPDGGAVTATCDEGLVSKIEGAPRFNADEIRGGFVADITITVDPPQGALLVQDDDANWEVTEILE